MWVARGNQFETVFITCWVPVEASTFMLSARFNQSMLCPRIRVRVVHSQVADSWSTYIDWVNPMVNVHLKLGMGYILLHVYTTHSCYICFFMIGYPHFPRIPLTSWDLPWQKLIIWSNQGPTSASPALRARRWLKRQALQMANAMAVHLAVGLEGPGWPLKKNGKKSETWWNLGHLKMGWQIFWSVQHWTCEPLEFGSVFEILVYVAAGWCLATSRCGWGCDEKNNLGTAFYVRFLWKFVWIHSDSILQFPSNFHPFSIHFPSIFHPFSGSCGRLSGDFAGRDRHPPVVPVGPSRPGGAEQHGLLEDAGSRRAMAADSWLCLHSMVGRQNHK